MIPFYVAASFSTFDLQNLVKYLIEEGDPREVTHIREKPITVKGVEVMNPALDITPPELVT